MIKLRAPQYLCSKFADPMAIPGQEVVIALHLKRPYKSFGAFDWNTHLKSVGSEPN